MYETINKHGLKAIVFLLFCLVFTLIRICNNEVKTVSEPLELVEITEEKQSKEIAELTREVSELEKKVYELGYKISKVDSLRVQNYLDSRAKSNQQHYGELSDRYTKQKANR